MRKGNSETLPPELADELRGLEQRAQSHPDEGELAAIPEARDWSEGHRGRFGPGASEASMRAANLASDRRSEANTRFEFILDVMEDATSLLAAPQRVTGESAEKMWVLLDRITQSLKQGGYERPRQS